MATKAHNLEPLDDWLVVEETTPPGQSRGGILLPDSAKKKTCRGKVLAAGPGKINERLAAPVADGALLPAVHRHPMPVKVNDEVLFGEWSGAEVEIDGAKLRFLRAGDVMSRFCK